MDASLLFPYAELRPEQERLVKDVQEAITSRKHLLAHAPTGLGKTVAVLGPALKYALEHNKTVFFLTSRHTQHLLAVRTLKDIKQAFGLTFSSSDIIAKKWMCCQPGVEQMHSGEFTEYCRTLRGEELCEYYLNTKQKGQVSRMAEAALVQIQREGPADTRAIFSTSKEHKVCPYEIAALAAKEAHVIVADYNYVFSESIRASFFGRAGKELGDCILIIDEGHNLPSRCREMLSERLSSFVLDRAIKEAQKYKYEEAEGHLTAMLGALNALGSQIEEGKEEEYVLKAEFVKAVEKIGTYDELAQQLEKIGDAVREEQRQSFIGAVASFLELWQGPDKGFCRSILKTTGKYGTQHTLQYKCLDPSLVTAPVLDACHSAILMSGTLSPVEMYADVLGFKRHAMEHYPDPFGEKHRLNLVIEEVSTKFTARNAQQYQNIAKILSEIVDAVPGNTLVFFPSYAVRNSVRQFFDRLSRKTVLQEQQGMSKEEKQQLLERFKGHEKQGAVLLAVTGGSFGEGVDLPGDLLKGVVVVGVPLSKPDLETKELVQYYDDKYGEGMSYGYIFPAITKIMQNAGRCIRTDTDRGVIVFMDARYTWEHYAKCFPPEWNMQITKRWGERIRTFFA